MRPPTSETEKYIWFQLFQELRQLLVYTFREIMKEQISIRGVVTKDKSNAVFFFKFQMFEILLQEK